MFFARFLAGDNLLMYPARVDNRPIEEWGQLVGDVPAVGAILDRFLHDAEVVTVQRKSHRMQDRTERAPEKMVEKDS